MSQTVSWPIIAGLMARIVPILLRLAPAAAIATVGAWWLFDWVVDDAAISYSYARNARLGLGLVSQAGRPPVEGFSNPLWVALLTTVARVDIDPRLALKTVSWVLEAAFLGAAAHSTMKRRLPLAAASAFLGLLALEPPVLIWCNSGLEGPLLFFGLVWLAEALARATRDASNNRVLAAGGAAAISALTRPEGVLFAISGIALLALSRDLSRTARVRGALLYVASFGVPLVAYVAFRRLYFNDWLPNTYYAKGGITVGRLLDAVSFSPHAIAKVLEVGEALGGYYGASAVLAFVVLLTTVVARSTSITAWSRAYLALSAAAVVSYVVLPGDWMGEYRYGAPAAILISMSLFHLSADIWESGKTHFSTHWQTILSVALVAAAGAWVERIYDFRDHLPMPLVEVTDRVRIFEDAGNALGIERASILTQDVGGFLLIDKLDVYDIGMLTDRRIARAIGEWRTEPDRRDLHNYVFDDVKPDFISVTAYHAWAAHLDQDPRLKRDYVPISAGQDEWVVHRYGELMESGNYVRRDRVRDPREPERLKKMLAKSRGP